MVIRIIPEKKKNAEADAVPSMGAADREFVAELVSLLPSLHPHPVSTGTWDRHEGPMMDPCALISTRPEVLSVENIAKVRNRLAFLGGLSRPMEECLDHALLTFIREAGCLQENAWLVTRCEGQQLCLSQARARATSRSPTAMGCPDWHVVSRKPDPSNNRKDSRCGIQNGTGKDYFWGANSRTQTRKR
ncbi:hypothetical protein KIL84_015121 [Mauremys mutica]|uniref:Uncharacterized protein n=1 Tax=Mauremys mutica TaxID=74926 RepID=A0A9D3WPA4_9SAUR|nr:hypothetical protein KIL84_015121 [Mauremys mutica]